MRKLLGVLPVLGVVLVVFCLTMLVPLAFSWVQDDGAQFDHLRAIASTLACGIVLRLLGHRYQRELQPRDGFVLVALVWTVLPAFGALPLWLAIDGLSPTDAYFEAVSGLTTTGATVLTGLERLPVSINVWRCLMVLIGGMGIVVLAVAVLPLLGVGGAQLFKAESAGPMKDEKLTPRIAETARGLWSVYFVFAVACCLAYRWAGMGWTDAFMHMCSTMGLGGFAAYDASFGAFDSPRIEAVAIVFMLLAGINFALYFMAFKRRSLRGLWRNIEVRGYVILMFGAVMLIAAFLATHQVYPTFGESLRHAAFSVVSVATTTGFATVDYALWPAFAPVLMLLLCGFATCAGSTGGGIKLIRALLLMKQAQRELIRIVHPRAVVPVTLGGQVVPQQVLISVIAYMLAYGAVTLIASLMLLFTGLDMVSAVTAVIACINNTGPGLGQVGPSGNYQGLSDVQTWICSATMLLGRLELLSLLVLFTPTFWRA
ncbi:cation transporter [Leptothrix cholodnii SP-6]|uniref:Trk system potassium uptake protein n=1 Tax=Leptothrix cholodnii (strain ATCC 51168 / LMG 8142 / SP-6) TaxID=395495 RepID=B1XWX4_LEPCP|nr:potassium transporter TrkG [Leptothrix cholodnii]ACB36323.1 cation transporter [Leptothrix cholodnii SP-6]